MICDRDYLLESLLRRTIEIREEYPDILERKKIDLFIDKLNLKLKKEVFIVKKKNREKSKR